MLIYHDQVPYRLSASTMPVTTDQVQSIDTYYEGRKPCEKLLFEALTENPPKKPPISPLDALNSKKEPFAQAKRAPYEESKKPKPVNFFQDIIDMFDELKIGKDGGAENGKAAKN